MSEAPPPFLSGGNAMIAAGVADEDWARPFPPRAGCRVRPLIEAADMYPELERLVLNARASIWMAFRIFDPSTATRSEEAEAAGLSDWAALIEHAVRRGVSIRILLADFEPVLADYLHAGSWSTFQALRAIVDRLEEGERDRLQLIVAQHEGELGRLWRRLLGWPLRRRVRGIVEKLLGSDGEDGGLATRPGLWRNVRWEGDTPKAWRAAKTLRLWPATYHQKFVVVDGERLIVGGLDLDERRWDDRRHRQRADRTWHDISAEVEGGAVNDAAAHFARLWNRELPRYREIVSEWTDGCGRELMLDPLTEAEPAQAARPPAGGPATVQLVRTLSCRSDSAVALGPRPGVRELKAAHRSLILHARRRLYIEGQFFRSRDAARWVAEALARNPTLEVIILIANVPEEIAFEGQSDNLAHRHGEFLQARAVGKLLRRAGPGRIGLFTLAKHQAAEGAEKAFEKDRGTAFGSGVIHIHSKMLIADDDACLLSSCNINGRSFEWDTELGIIWKDEGGDIRAFRRRLWDQLFGGRPPESDDLDGWRDIARHNSGAEPDDRRGFIVPYQLGRARRFGRPYWFIPDDLV